MNRRLLIPIALVLGVVVAIEYLTFFGGSEEVPAVVVDDATDSSAGSEETAAGATDAPLAPIGELTLATWLESLGRQDRTPFLTLAEIRAREPKNVVHLPRFGGTLWSRGRRIVWLDERPYAEGDRPDGFTVATIEPSGVVLLIAGRPVRLSFSQGEPPSVPAPEVNHVP